MKSPEGIPWKDYKLFKLLLVLPISLFFAGYLELIWFFSKKKSVLVNFSDVPSNAILYDFHRDVMTNYVTMRMIRSSGKTVKFLNYHGLLSYLAFGCGCTGAYEVIRFRFDSKKRPLQQVIETINYFSEALFGLFTDAGKPYGQVRTSLVEISKATNRPLVPFVSRFQPSLRFFETAIPLPFGKGQAVFGRTIFPDEIKDLSIEAAQQFLQQERTRI